MRVPFVLMQGLRALVELEKGQTEVPVAYVRYPDFRAE